VGIAEKVFKFRGQRWRSYVYKCHGGGIHFNNVA